MYLQRNKTLNCFEQSRLAFTCPSERKPWKQPNLKSCACTLSPAGPSMSISKPLPYHPWNRVLVQRFLFLQTTIHHVKEADITAFFHISQQVGWIVCSCALLLYMKLPLVSRMRGWIARLTVLRRWGERRAALLYNNPIQDQDVETDKWQVMLTDRGHCVLIVVKGTLILGPDFVLHTVLVCSVWYLSSANPPICWCMREDYMESATSRVPLSALPKPHISITDTVAASPEVIAHNGGTKMSPPPSFLWHPALLSFLPHSPNLLTYAVQWEREWRIRLWIHCLLSN